MAWKHAAFDAMPGHVAVLDHAGVIRLTNHAWRRFAAENGYAASGAGVGLSYLEICAQTRGREAAVALDMAAGLRRLLHGGAERFRLGSYACHGAGRCRWFAIEAQRLDGGGAVVLHLDVSSIRARTEAHRDAVLADPLTGLPTRTLLDDRLAQAIHAARGCGGLIGLVLIDIESSADLNAATGREAADELLRLAAARIRSRMRSSDTAARLDGGTFAVLLTNLHAPADLDLWQAVALRACRLPACIGGRDIAPRVRHGAALFPFDGESPAALIAAAARRRYAEPVHEGPGVAALNQL